MSNHSVELLAPAGSPEALSAAIANGADAVYMGGTMFSARAFAENFDERAMADAIRRAHLYGVRVYVTVNTLVNPEELPQALRYMRHLYESGADAVIVQDLGLMAAARDILPQLPLHASTQMTIHNAWGCRFLERVGVQRVVLAREVSLAEIRSIREKVGIPIEVFVHGALCFSYSGQCLLSSIIGGRSGNRGKCAQPCRMEYALVDEAGRDLGKALSGRHLISPADLNSLALLPDLIRAGVAALKIEGRMKRPEYVATVVRIYRAALDRVQADPEHYRALFDEERDLEQVFNRGFTTGYLVNRPGADLMSYQRPNNRGMLLGRITGFAGGGWYTLRLEQPLGVGDGVEVWVTRGGRAGTEVSEIRVGGKNQPAAPAGSIVELPLPGRPRVGDRVFKTSDAGLLKEAQNSFGPGSPGLQIPVRIRFEATPGRTSDLYMEDMEGHGVHVSGEFVAEPAQRHPLTGGKVREQLSRLGGTAFFMQDFEAVLQGEVMVPVSELNTMRRQGIELLEQARLAAWRPAPFTGGFEEALGGLFSRPRPQSNKPALSVSVSDMPSLRAALNGGADRLYFGGESFRPAGGWAEEDLAEAIAQCRLSGAQAVVSLPRIVAEGETGAFERWLKRALALKPDGVIVRNPGQYEWLRELWQGVVMADYPVNVFNHLAVSALAGIRLVTLSPELTLSQIGDISGLMAALRPEVQPEVLVHGKLTLMISEHCPIGALMGGGAGEAARGCTLPCRQTRVGLKDRMGLVFPVRTDASCRMHLFNSMDLSLLADIPKLGDMGLGVRIEGLAHTPHYLETVVPLYRRRLDGRMSESALEDAVSTLERLSPQGLTRGHYYRGV